MRRVADKTTTNETDEKVDEDDRQQARAEHSFETFGQLAPIFDAKNKQHTHEAKQRTGSACRRYVSRVKDKTSKQATRQTRTYRQVTANRAGDAGNYPEHDKLCGPIKLLDEWSKYQQAEHVHQQVKNIDVNEHRCDEAPPLVVRRVDEVIELGAICDQHRIRKTSLQGGKRHPA